MMTTDLATAVQTLFPAPYQGLAQKIMTWSPYFAAQLERHPAWIPDLLANPHPLGDLASRLAHDFPTGYTDWSETDFLRRLREVRHREMCRLAWRDLCRYSSQTDVLTQVPLKAPLQIQAQPTQPVADLAEVLQTSSDLASHLLDIALHWHEQRLQKMYGVPRDTLGNAQRLVIIGMGKLGGRELNFSSDIDLIFAFPEKGYTDGRKTLDNQRYFIRLGQQLNKSLNQMTADGFVYRVDMRLRPFGKAGALVLPFDAMEHYYQTHGREWERYAWIKADVVAGDKQQGRVLLDRLKPFFYRIYLDFGAIEHLRDIKAKISQEAHHRGAENNIKLGVGGIRDIEFIVQSFQLVRGGRLLALQQRHLLATLPVLAAHGLLDATLLNQLQQAYEFLRDVENRLQMRQDQQTHQLPTHPDRQKHLAESMGFADWYSFSQQLAHHRQFVAAQFALIFAAPDEVNAHDDYHTHNKQTDEHETSARYVAYTLWHDIQADNDHHPALALEQALKTLGFQLAAESLIQLVYFKQGHSYTRLTDTARERLDTLMPRLLQECTTQGSPDRALQRALAVLEKIAGRSGYLSLLATEAVTLQQFVRLIHASQWITKEIREHPMLLDELLDPRQLYRVENRASLAAQLDDELKGIDAQDTETIMERLRHFKRTQVLRIAAVDVMDAIPLVSVSDQLSWIAEVILQAVQQLAWSFVYEKHGVPYCLRDGKKQRSEFAILAYGKLGGLELSYRSDLDLVFIHNDTGEQSATQVTSATQKSIDGQVFFMRLAQRVVALCNTLSYSGRLYEIDTRLRPNGLSGLLVSSVRGFERYQHEQAWLWEHQALVRARVVTGSAALQATLSALRQHILAKSRDPQIVRGEVRKMREKMWLNLDKSKAGEVDLKQSTGGIADIEFMVQYLVLAYAADYPNLLTFSDNIRILSACKQAGVLSAEDADLLSQTYQDLRAYVHILALQEQTTMVSDQLFIQERQAVKALWQRLMVEG
ncbi:MAG: bifunctional [glutamate--ammonia ligase]-adenylyl-L-tyrosine phosphorylase/[glutamate--ammonia-ligase] adenylyltransferase [bacterium]